MPSDRRNDRRQSDRLLDCAIPFLERYSTSRIFEEHGHKPFGRIHPARIAVARGGLAALRGEAEAATGFFRAAMSGERSDAYDDVVRKLPAALAIDLNGGSKS